MTDEIKMNYHNTLREIKDVFDPVIIDLRNAQTESTYEHWQIKWLLLPFKEIPSLMKAFKGIKNLNPSAIPLIGGILSGIIAWFFNQPTWIVTLASFLLCHIGVLTPYFTQLCTLGHRNFHIVAYSKFSSKEYELADFQRRLFRMPKPKKVEYRSQKEINEQRRKFREKKISRLHQKVDRITHGTRPNYSWDNLMKIKVIRKKP